MRNASRSEQQSDWDTSGGYSVFRGETLAAAVSAAVATHGPGATVKAARKVKQGLKGLVGKDFVEVLAGPSGALATTAHPAANAHPATTAHPATAGPVRGAAPVAVEHESLDSALEALMRQADLQEHAVAAPSSFAEVLRESDLQQAARSGVGPVEANPADVAAFTALVQQALRRVPEADPSDELVATLARMGATAAHGVTAPAAHAAPAAAAPAAVTALSVDAAPVTDAGIYIADAGLTVTLPEQRGASRKATGRAASRPTAAAVKRTAKPSPTRATSTAAVTKAAPSRAARRAPAAPGWSRTALAAIGVPAEVLQHLPAHDPTDDLAWLVAVAQAIEAVVPEPAEASGADPVVMTGFGVEGAVAMLRGGVAGLTPGTLTIGDRTVAASATEIALAVRAVLVP